MTLKYVRWLIQLGESGHFDAVMTSLPAKRSTAAVSVERFTLSSAPAHTPSLKKDVGSYKTEVNDLLMDLHFGAEGQGAPLRIALASASALLFKSIGFCRKFAFFAKTAASLYKDLSLHSPSLSLFLLASSYYQLPKLIDDVCALPSYSRSYLSPSSSASGSSSSSSHESEGSSDHLVENPSTASPLDDRVILIDPCPRDVSSLMDRLKEGGPIAMRLLMMDAAATQQAIADSQVVSLDLSVPRTFAGKGGWWGLQKDVLFGLYESAREMESADVAFLFLTLILRRLCRILTADDHEYLMEKMKELYAKVQGGGGGRGEVVSLGDAGSWAAGPSSEAAASLPRHAFTTMDMTGVCVCVCVCVCVRVCASMWKRL